MKERLIDAALAVAELLTVLVLGVFALVLVLALVAALAYAARYGWELAA